MCILGEINNHYYSSEEEFEKIKDKTVKLINFSFKPFEMLEECFHIDHRSYEAFSGDYSFSFRDYYTGEKDCFFEGLFKI